MTQTKKKVGKKIMKWILLVLLAIFVLYFLIQGILCLIGINKANQKLKEYNVQTASLSYGDMTYIDEGEGEVILSVHGILVVMIKPMKQLKAEKIKID